MNEFVEVVMTETDINARAAMYDAIIFSQLILGRIGYKELDENVEWIREVGYNLGLGVIQCDEDALRLFEKASTACLNCIDAFAAGKCSPEHWGLTNISKITGLYYRDTNGKAHPINAITIGSSGEAVFTPKEATSSYSSWSWGSSPAKKVKETEISTTAPTSSGSVNLN